MAAVPYFVTWEVKQPQGGNLTKTQWTSINILVYKIIIVIIVLILYELLDLLLAEDGSKEREFGMER